MKVTGPFHSDDARGSFAGSIVASGWKGVKYLRQLVIPKNNKTADDGDRRQIFGGIGRACSVVGVNSTYHLNLIAGGRISAGQSKQSALVRFIKNAYMEDATAFEAVRTAFVAHSAKADFTEQAIGLGLYDLNITYKGTTNAFSAGMMLYILAEAGIDMNFPSTPYSVALGTWVKAQILLLVADLVAGA